MRKHQDFLEILKRTLQKFYKILKTFFLGSTHLMVYVTGFNLQSHSIVSPATKGSSVWTQYSLFEDSCMLQFIVGSMVQWGAQLDMKTASLSCIRSILTLGSHWIFRLFWVDRTYLSRPRYKHCASMYLVLVLILQRHVT